MAWPVPSLQPYRQRILLRAAFLSLAAATVGLAISVLQQEKQLSYQSYAQSFRKTQDQLGATLRHPTGQLALLNPPAAAPGSELHPLLLPFPALDFDDQYKVQQAVAMSGCLAQVGEHGSICTGIGNNPWAGGFIYVAGTFDSAQLVPHPKREVSVDQAHRVVLKVAMRGAQYHWIAPFEQPVEGVESRGGMQGRLTGFTAADAGRPNARPVRDFRGWIWQSPVCTDAAMPPDDARCRHSTFFSVRLPVGVLQDALFDKARPVWPPEDLDKIGVHLAVLGPGDGAPLLDTARDRVAPGFRLTDLRAQLLPGETLRISKTGGPELLRLEGAADSTATASPLLARLVRRLPVTASDAPLTGSMVIATPLGNYTLELHGDARSVNQNLSVVATRVSWFVGAMLGALLLAWLVVEVGIIRRITALTRRADSVAQTVKGSSELAQQDFSDLRGQDELGVLARCLQDLLRRVREDAEREAIRAEQERDMWHAVGHEIMSPLQSLMALHGAEGNQSKRYIERMQQAVRILYGSASPSEAFQSSAMQLEDVDLDAFLQSVAANASCAGIAGVCYDGPGAAVMVRADEHALEDVITHILQNAARHREAGSTIRITLEAGERNAAVGIHNQGMPIAEEMLDKVFEYGVSSQDGGAAGSRGQGLFVAKTYMAKMGGTIAAHNVAGGVAFTLNLQRS
ncbi:sensor histidine kinase [Pseudoduganella aquatica]|uniref:sensor histidine kinase n=1 Tax=Pseudoduganella aquatica TaxID=2660641 RepID=UPI001E5D8EF5|nr:HAMP domain-containing sensor histidine kinase [Pseudoduganella aquatica]